MFVSDKDVKFFKSIQEELMNNYRLQDIEYMSIKNIAGATDDYENIYVAGSDTSVEAANKLIILNSDDPVAELVQSEYTNIKSIYIDRTGKFYFGRPHSLRSPGIAVVWKASYTSHPRGL